jgi:hypothetical protein
MKKFPHVEDYLEIINGDRNPDTGKLYGLFESTPPIVSLARYDVSVLGSMSTATSEGRGLTDRQAELAVKIILKYRKQLEKLEIDITPVESPQFRNAIRVIDRRRMLLVDNNKIVLKFPYDTQLIDSVRELSKLSEGTWRFDSTAKAWHLAITETNVVAANGFARNNQFEIDAEFDKLLQAVLSCEAVPYEIKLVPTDTGYTITNAAPSLTDYINNWCGFHPSNIDLLVDNSAILGYTVDRQIEEEIISKYSPRVYNLMRARETKFAPTADPDVIEDVIRYAQAAGRYPIYIYEPDLSDRLLNNFVKPNFNDSEVYRTMTLKEVTPTVHTKVIYFNKFHASWQQPIPLLISGQGMMHGGEKSMLLQRAEKVVYFVTEVYNNKNLKRN